MTKFSMGFAGVEDLLADVNSIRIDKRTAFQARLKNFLRLGLLPGVKEGRGKAASYESHQMFMLALAVEFTQLGFPPDAAVAMIGRSLPEIVAAIRSIPKTETDTSSWSPRIVYFDPAGLSSLMDDAAVNQRRTLSFAPVDQFKDNLRELLASGSTRLALIDVTGLVVELADALERSSSHKGVARFFAQALYDWAATAEAREIGQVHAHPDDKNA